MSRTLNEPAYEKASDSSRSNRREKVKWLVMIYLAGDNSLSEECVFALTEMRRIGSNTDVKVFAQLDTGVHDNTPLFIKHGTSPGETNDELNKAQEDTAKKKAAAAQGSLAAELPPTYSDVVFNFIKACIAKYDADHHMIVLSGHGGGITENFLRKEEADRVDSLSVLSIAKLIRKVKE